MLTQEQMSTVGKFIVDLQGTTSTAAKAAKLRGSANIPGLLDVLRFINNGYIKTGIAKKKFARGQHAETDGKQYDFYDLMEYLETHNTGTNNDLYRVWLMINSFPQEAKIVGEAIATKTVKMGVTATTLNNVFGKNFVPKIGIMLGESFANEIDKMHGEYIITEKFDGNRRIIVKHHGTTTIMTRSGKFDDDLLEIAEQAQHLPDNYVYDMEVVAAGDHSDNIATRQATASIANSKGPKTGLIAHIFDMISYSEFAYDTRVTPATVRKATLANLFGDTQSVTKLGLTNTIYTIPAGSTRPALIHNPVLKAAPVLDVLHCENIAGIMEHARTIWQQKGEGIMLLRSASSYQLRRSRDLLKIKKFLTYDLQVVGFEEGQGRNKGRLGALIVEAANGVRSRCGSGFDDYAREHIWENRDLYLGDIVEIECQGVSENLAGGLSFNCPIFKRFRDDKHTPDAVSYDDNLALDRLGGE